MCVFVHSRFIENPPIWSWETNPSFLRWFCHKVREWYVASRHLQDCSLRLCRLRTDGLALMSKYWTYRSHAGDMGPVSLVVSCQQKVSFSPTTSLVDSGEKLGTNPRIGQTSCCGLCRDPFFSGAVTLLNSVDDCVKDCYMWTMWDTFGLGPYTDWAWKACGVLVVGPVFPCRVYTDLNRCDSRIWVLFVCVIHHIVTHELNLINVIIVILL
jgi:hypothetical protein